MKIEKVLLILSVSLLVVGPPEKVMGQELEESARPEEKSATTTQPNVAPGTGPSAASVDKPAQPMVSPSEDPTPNFEGKGKPVKMGLSQSSFNLGAAESMVAWDKWHHRVGKALSKKAKSVTHGMVGFAAFDVLIFRNHSLQVQMLRTTNRKMSDVCLAAIQTLNNDPELEFPPETQRDAMRFTFEYKRGLVLLPHNQYITGDYEHLNDEAKTSRANP